MQRAMLGALGTLSGTSPDAAARHLAVDGIDAAALLAIHANNSAAALHRSLQLSYPAVRKLVGDEFFRGAALRFSALAPPRSAWLDEYGEGFPAFLADFAPSASRPYLAEVARLEWAVNRALHARDATVVDLAQLAASSASQVQGLCLVLHPAIGLLESRAPVDAIWRATLEGDDAALARIDLQAGPVHLLVERRESGVEVRKLDVAAWTFIAGLQAGKPIGPALETDPEPAKEWLAEHFAAGRIIDYFFIDRIADE